jgi:hypothetical protein
VAVSNIQPIVISLATLDLDVVATEYVPINGGPFVLHAPAAGIYYLAYSVDVHNYRDGKSFSVGAPFEFYNNRYSVPPPGAADPVVVPQAGLNLDFGDAGLLPGIAGNVAYTGNQSGVRIGVQAFTDPSFTGAPDRDSHGLKPGCRYELEFMNPGQTYYLRSFPDFNDNRQPDPGEPFAACSNPVVAGADQTSVTIIFGDQGAATCVVLPPPALCGDCNGDGAVTANEITRVISNVFENSGGPPTQ